MPPNAQVRFAKFLVFRGWSHRPAHPLDRSTHEGGGPLLVTSGRGAGKSPTIVGCSIVPMPGSLMGNSRIRFAILPRGAQVGWFGSEPTFPGKDNADEGTIARSAERPASALYILHSREVSARENRSDGLGSNIIRAICLSISASSIFLSFSLQQSSFVISRTPVFAIPDIS